MIITFRKWAFYAYRSNALRLTTKPIFYRDAVYGSEQSMTRFGAGNAGRNDELWLGRKGEWPAVQLTRNEWAWGKHPRWSPDGAQIILLSNRSGGQQLWLMNADGGNQRHLTNFAFDV